VDVTYIVDPVDSDCPKSLVWRKEKQDPRVDNILRMLNLATSGMRKCGLEAMMNLRSKSGPQ